METFLVLFIFLLNIFLPHNIQSLQPFDPWASTDNLCTQSMETCTFWLEATNAVTMFYKQLFRVVATSDGSLHKYNDLNKTFDLKDVITGDGYPKLVSDKHLLYKKE